MASDLYNCPKASDGAGYDDHNNPCYRDRRANSAAAEAGEHCQKLQCMAKVSEMQAGQTIRNIYSRITRFRLPLLLLLVKERIERAANRVSERLLRLRSLLFSALLRSPSKDVGEHLAW